MGVPFDFVNEVDNKLADFTKRAVEEHEKKGKEKDSAAKAEQS